MDAVEASSMSNKERYSKWRLDSARVRAKYQLSSSYSGWTSHTGVRGVPSTPRCADLINVAWGARVKSAAFGANRESLADNFLST